MADKPDKKKKKKKKATKPSEPPAEESSVPNDAPMGEERPPEEKKKKKKKSAQPPPVAQPVPEAQPEQQDAKDGPDEQVDQAQEAARADNPQGEDDEAPVFISDVDVIQAIDLPDDGPVGDEDEAKSDEDEGKDREEDAGEESISNEQRKSERKAPPRDDSTQKILVHQDSVFSVSINPADESKIVSGGQDDVAYISDLKTGKQIAKLSGHSDSVIQVGWSYDGKYVASGSMDGTIRVYAPDGKLSSVLEGPAKEIQWFEWHPKGNVIAAGSEDNTVWLWNAAKGEHMVTFTGHQAGVICGAWTYDGKMLCTGSEDASMFVWNPKDGKAIHHIKGKQFSEAPITALATHPSQMLALAGGADGEAKVVNLTTGKVVSSLRQHTDSIECAGFCKTLKLAATGSLDGKICIWDLGTSQCRTTLPHDGGIVDLRWHPTDPLIYSGSLDRTLRIWDARTGKCVKQWIGHYDNVLAFDITKDGRTVISGSDDFAVLVFKV